MKQNSLSKYLYAFLLMVFSVNIGLSQTVVYENANYDFPDDPDPLPDNPDCGKWNVGRGKNDYYGDGNHEKIIQLMPGYTKKVYLKKNILVTDRIFIGTSLLDGEYENPKPATLEIYNGTDKDIHIYAYIYSNKNGSNVLFSVWKNATLKIHGKPNAKIYLHGVNGHENGGIWNNTIWGFIESTGNIDFENVVIQDVTFSDYSYMGSYHNQKDGDTSVFKLSPWTHNIAQGEAINLGQGTTTLKNCRITNINNTRGGYASILTTFGKPLTADGNNRASNKITFENVEVDHVTQNGYCLTRRYEADILDNSPHSAGLIRFRGAWVGDFDMINCSIHDNKSTGGDCAGVVWNAIGDGASESTMPLLTIKGCKFYNNETAYDAGALKLEGRFKFDFGTNREYNEIYNNTAQRGGGIMIWGYSGGDPVTKQTINQEFNESVKIYNNTATSQGGGMMINYDNSACKLPSGMVINTTISGAQFTDNTAKWQGGGLCLNKNDTKWTTNLYLDKGSFTGNKVTNTDNGCGGGLHTWNFDINSHSNSTDWLTFDNNTSAKDGGGIFIEGTSQVTLDKLKINNCTASNYGGGVYIKNSTTSLTLKEVSITNNKSYSFGGGICSEESGALKFDKGVISGNKVTRTDNDNHGAGGGIYMRGTSLTIGEGQILSNSSDSFNGGGVYLENSTLTMNDGKITGNYAKWRGGGVYASSSSFTLNKGAINNNTATNEWGGGLSLVCSDFIMKGGEINGNKAGGFGGGIFFDNHDGGNKPVKTFLFENGSISNNTSGNHGGGICIYAGNTSNGNQTITLKSGTISGNRAADGGGIYMNGWSKDVLNIESTTIENNTAYAGGGVLIYNSTLNYNDGLIRNNRAISRDSKKAPLTMCWTNHCNNAISGADYLRNDQPREDINGVGGGLLVSLGGKMNLGGTQFGIYGNYAQYGGDDILSVGNDANKITLPDVTKMTLRDFDAGVPQSALFWAQDYINGDTGYTNKPSGSEGSSVSDAKRYRDKIAEVSEHIYEIAPNKEYVKEYVSVALGYKYVYTTVEKTGLKKGESAVINFYPSKSITQKSKPYMQIVLTGTDDTGSKVAKTVAIPVGDWTVMETGWSWTYGGKSSTGETALDCPAITRTLTKNSSGNDMKFSFTNTKQVKEPNAENVKVNDNMNMKK